MSELVPFPISKTDPGTLEELVEKTHQLAKQSENVWLDHPHAKQRMAERNITTRQIFDVLRNGTGITGPTLDKYGDWRIKLKRFSAGRAVQVVVVIKSNHLEVVTVI